MNEWNTATELPWLWAGMASYALATFIVIRGVVLTRGGAAGAAVNRSYETPVFIFILAGVALLAMALAERWIRIGHGPFVNLFELLMSQLFSLGVIYSFAYWRYPAIRASAVVALPLMWILGVWVLMLEPSATAFRPPITTTGCGRMWASVNSSSAFVWSAPAWPARYYCAACRVWNPGFANCPATPWSIISRGVSCCSPSSFTAPC